jgi:single-stranded DNA-binding protein
MENNKYYSFFNANTSIGSEDNKFISVTTIVTVSNFRDQMVDGTLLVSGRAPIANRSNIMSTVLNREVTPDENGNVWVDVTVWGDRAERFKKYLNGREKVRLVIVGTLAAKDFKRTDGTPGVSYGIKVTDWANAEFRPKEQ